MSMLRDIRDAVKARWTDQWTHGGVPVYWRDNDDDVLADPATVQHFLRNEIDFGREIIRAFGGGLHNNERLKFGTVRITVFTSRTLRTEDTTLDLLSDAEGVFRSFRGSGLGFTDHMPTWDSDESGGPALEDGNWFKRGSLILFEYRFTG